MIRRAEELKDMASECRALARAASHKSVREELLEVAERFERSAREREQKPEPVRLNYSGVFASSRAALSRIS